MIKLPKDFIDEGYKFDIAIPTAKIETARIPEGSFDLRVWYETNEINEVAKQAAREMNEKVEAAIMDELLRLNGYVPERTCRMDLNFDYDGDCPAYYRDFVCSKCKDDFIYYKHSRINYCPHCGAKVVE